MMHFGILTLVLWSFASAVYACPVCNSETGDAVRAGIQDNFGYNLLAAVSPFAFGGWVANESTTIFLIVGAAEDVEKSALALSRIGIDNIGGFLVEGLESWREEGCAIERVNTTKKGTSQQFIFPDERRYQENVTNIIKIPLDITPEGVQKAENG